MQKIPTYLVDSFTATPFKGNPAGVCLLDKELSSETMQAIATELGYSETAFVQEMDGYYAIRYFSPMMEIDLCGHATLASARVLFDQNDVDEITFLTKNNLQLITKRSGDRVAMTFPAYTLHEYDLSDALLSALQLNSYEQVYYNEETGIVMIEIAGCSVLRAINPTEADLLAAVTGIMGVVVTAVSDEQGLDFESRHFWPWAGGLEDPVTGASHTFLAPYWQTRLGKTDMTAYQCSARGGYLYLKLADDQVEISGDAVIVLRGEMMV